MMPSYAQQTWPIDQSAIFAAINPTASYPQAPVQTQPTGGVPQAWQALQSMMGYTPRLVGGQQGSGYQPMWRPTQPSSAQVAPYSGTQGLPQNWYGQNQSSSPSWNPQSLWGQQNPIYQPQTQQAQQQQQPQAQGFETSFNGSNQGSQGNNYGSGAQTLHRHNTMPSAATVGPYT